MMQIVKQEQRRTNHHGWLTTTFHFSFADYVDRQNMGWGCLRVFNDDYIESGGSFDLHPHANYEIITIVTTGQIAHGDSMGNSETIGEYQVQAMTAGTGVYHSESNNGKEQVHSYQIWITPKKLGAKPTYKTAAFSPSDFHNRLVPLVAGDGRAPLRILADAAIFRSRLQKGKKLVYEFEEEFGYVFVIEGKLALDGKTMSKSDSAKIKREKRITIEAKGERKEFC